MQELDHPDLFYLRAAQGWLELGNCAEAAAELERIQPVLHDHPAVLELRWQLALKGCQWEDGLHIAEALCRLAPESPFGWIHRSYCLHELKRTQEAWDLLLPIVDRYPEEWLIRYNLACYAAQLGRLQEARTWLERAAEIGDAAEVKALAAKDPDLKPLLGA